MKQNSKRKSKKNDFIINIEKIFYLWNQPKVSYLSYLSNKSYFKTSMTFKLIRLLELWNLNSMKKVGSVNVFVKQILIKLTDLKHFSFQNKNEHYLYTAQITMRGLKT